MSSFLVLAYLFFIGSIAGWFIELLFRRFLSKNNPERKWINPGFCIGPYIPLYGFGLCALYGMTYIDEQFVPDTIWGFVIMIAMMSVSMTVIELLAGLMVLKLSNIRLWDYSREWGNYKGLICPKFSLIWAGCAVLYYFFVHPEMIKGIIWLSENLAFSFVIGLFFGVFIIDVIYSGNIVSKLRKYAVENGIIVKYEELKSSVRRVQDETKEKANFVFALGPASRLKDHLDKSKDTFEKKIK